MPVIELELVVEAPRTRVFDLSRSVEMHTESTSKTKERAIAGVTTGLLGPGDEVTWSAVHFGLRQKLTSRLTAFDRPAHFRDSMVRGAFARFDHDHYFIETSDGCLAREVFDFDSPLGILGRLADRLVLVSYMRSFLEERARLIQRVAESEDWKRFLLSEAATSDESAG